MHLAQQGMRLVGNGESSSDAADTGKIEVKAEGLPLYWGRAVRDCAMWILLESRTPGWAAPSLARRPGAQQLEAPVRGEQGGQEVDVVGLRLQGRQGEQHLPWG